MMPTRRFALAVFLLAVTFFLFFGAAKHDFASVNPFGEDPYDAVGSFGIQLALFAALLALLRAFRPLDTRGASVARTALVLRAATVSLLAVAATLAADGIALARFPGVWTAVRRGWILAGWTAALTGVTGVLLGMLGQAAGRSGTASSPRRWRRAVAVCGVGFGILAVYPIGWRAGIAGAILTALLGMVLLFVLVRATDGLFFPDPPANHDGAFDDIGAVLERIRERVPALAPLLSPFRAIAGRLSSRRLHGWFVAAVAAAMGVALVLIEVSGEGLAPDRRRAMLVVTVILSIEGAGVWLGYALLGELLGVFRGDGPP